MHDTVSAGETVARLFKHRRDAEQAVAQLRAAGFADVRVSERAGRTFEEHLDPREGHTSGDFAAALAGAGFPPDDARRLTRGIEDGDVLVTVPAGARTADARAVFAGRPVSAQPLGPVDAPPARGTAPPPAPAAAADPATGAATNERGEAEEPSLRAGDRIVQTHGEVLDIEKQRAQSEARVRRETVTEQRTITVPVQHEELVVERDGADPVRIPVKDEDPPAEGH
jgi:hypothetical protein